MKQRLQRHLLIEQEVCDDNLDLVDGFPISQATLFQAMDILLTAGLIAGGSKGINAITGVIGEFLDTSRERATEAANKPGQESQQEGKGDG